MLITDKSELEQFYAKNRLWQGVPSTEITKKGRIYITFYSGGTTEEIGNYSFIIYSDDGVNFSEPIVAAYQKNYRCFDPCVWIDPLGRLWFTWTRCPEYGLYASICENPDADELVWSEEFKVGENVMMNKPIALSSGEWLFPIAVWDEGIKAIDYDEDQERGAFAYRTIDNGKTFEKIGGVGMPYRSFDEHMLLERENGSIRMYVRTNYGIGIADSYDGGKTWTNGINSGVRGPDSRFHIRRLKSGRVLLVNHDDTRLRENLTAYLSEDDGVTWKYKLMLDSRRWVSYPDAIEDENGYIYIVYDKDRGAALGSLSQVQNTAREILMAKITEDDIINGKICDDNSYLMRVVSKLGKYEGENPNPYKEFDFYTDEFLAKSLIEQYKEPYVIEKIFERYRNECWSIRNENAVVLDEKITEYENADASKKLEVFTDIIAFIRKEKSNRYGSHINLIDQVYKLINENLSTDLKLEDIATQIGISKKYLSYIFSRIAIISYDDYLQNCKLSAIKKMLMTKITIEDISAKFGFENSNLFCEWFKSLTNIEADEYKKLHNYTFFNTLRK